MSVVSSSVSAAAPNPAATRVTRLVVVTVFLDLLGFGIIIPLLPFYVESMGGSASTVGVLLSCFAFSQLLATPVLGKLSGPPTRSKPVDDDRLGGYVRLAANGAGVGSVERVRRRR